MAVNENDCELLHCYLDGELPVAECEGLWRRLAVEHDLTTELDRLRADHGLRSVVWSTLEPDDHAVVRLQSRVMRATRREDILSMGHRVLRLVTAAAALILFGFTVGWLGRDRVTPVPYAASPTPASQVRSAGMVGSPVPTNKYIVYGLDKSGKRIPLKQFDTQEEAYQFIQDMRSHFSAPTGDDPNAVPGTDKF